MTWCGFLQKQVVHLEEKLAKEGKQSHATQAVLLALEKKVAGIKAGDLATDLPPLFESMVSNTIIRYVSIY